VTLFIRKFIKMPFFLMCIISTLLKAYIFLLLLLLLFLLQCALFVVVFVAIVVVECVLFYCCCCCCCCCLPFISLDFIFIYYDSFSPLSYPCQPKEISRGYRERYLFILDWNIRSQKIVYQDNSRVLYTMRISV